jgi:hypothetical protein
MVYTSSLSSAVDNSAVDNCSFGDSFARRYRNLDVGYILSGVGILWVLSIAAALAVPSSSLPNCQLQFWATLRVARRPTYRLLV